MPQLKLLFHIFSVLLLAKSLHAHDAPKAKPTKTQQNIFIENRGQWPADILFRAEMPQGNILVTHHSILYQLVGFEPIKSNLPAGSYTNPHVSASQNKLKGHVIKISFPLSNPDFHLVGKKGVHTQFQYLKDKNPEKWVQGAKAFEEIDFQELYPGIDLKLYFHKGLLKYDFVVQPGHDPNQITLQYDGVEKMSVKDNFLILPTCLGKVFEKPPFAYQIHDDGKKQIDCNFSLKKNKVKFDLKNYDSSKQLVIDPELVFSTYSGSLADNWGNTATYDEEGNFYSGGIVFGNQNFPVTPGPFGSYVGGDKDILILKFSPDGKDLLFAAYLGGSLGETPISMIVNNQGNLVVMGITGSADFPVTANAFDRDFNGGILFDAFYDTGTIPSGFEPYTEPFQTGCDIFIAILDTKANNLIASTYVGGSDNDGIVISRTPNVKNYGDQLRGEVVVDSADNVYIASHTLSDTIAGFPTNGLPHHRNQGFLDALVLKLNPDLSNISWLHFLGGSRFECGFGIRVDASTGNSVYVTGGTNSNDLFQGNATGYKPTYSGNVDGYIAKLSPNGQNVVKSTFLGTSSYDQCYLIDLDNNADVYVFGQTQGSYPVSANTYSNPNSGQFIHKLSNDLSTSGFSTVFGSGSGTPDISPTAFMVNNCRKIFLSGWGGVTNRQQERIYVWQGSDRTQLFYYDYFTGYVGGNTTGMAVSSDAFQKTSNGTGFYFMILQPEASSLAYATHFGGSSNNREHVDGGTSRFSKKGVIYQSVCAGCGGESNFPTPVPGVWSVTNNSSNCNNAALKFDLGRVIARFETFDSLKAIPSKYGCSPITFLIKNKSSGATNYKWDVGVGVVTFKRDSIFIRFPNRGFQNITLIAFDTSICNVSDTMRATVNAGDVRVDFVPDIRQCGLAPVNPGIKLYTPWAKVRWKPTEGLSDSTIANPIISYLGKDMVYYISVTDDTLCMKFDTLSVKIRDPNPTARFIIMDSSKTVEKYSFCYPNSVFLKSKSTYYDYLEWKKDNNSLFVNVDSFYQIFPALGKTKYELFIYDSVCARGSTVQKILTLSKPFPTYPNNVSVCQNNPISVGVTGDPAFRYFWQPTELFANPNAPSQTFVPKQNGRIDITVTDTIGCTDKGFFNYSVIGTEDPIQEKEFTLCLRKEKYLDVFSLPMLSYFWQPSGYAGNPLRVTEEGTYYFKGTDANGCQVKDTVKVLEYCPPQLHVPTAFSPNGDGLNDMFQVFGNDIVAFDIKIFNRWGELIYQSNDFNFKWDGKYKGETIPIETYPYVISYKGAKYKDQELSRTFLGDVTVVR